MVNAVKENLTRSYETHLQKLKDQALARSLESDALDVTLPGRGQESGSVHPRSDNKCHLVLGHLAVALHALQRIGHGWLLDIDAAA